MLANDRSVAARRRIWSETLPFAQLTSPRVVGLLRRYALDPLVAVRPPDLAAMPRVVRALADAGVRVGLWPMLDDRDGRWANTRNAVAYSDLAMRVVDACGADDHVKEIAFDLEPAFADVSAIAGADGASTWRAALRVVAGGFRGFDAAEARLAGALRELEARGIDASAALLPPVLFPGPAQIVERALGTPASRLAWAHASAMAYTSMLEGWSRGRVSRPRARAILAWTSRAAVARFGGRAGISLGVVGTGAFGDEPVYRAPTELAEDVAVTQPCGAPQLTLFDLGGVLARPPAEGWLDAFTGAANAHVR